MTKKEMTASLMNQLRLQGKKEKFYEDLVNDYVYYWGLKKKLITDINKRGVRYTTKNGNGLEVEKPNESIVNVQKVTITMLKILNDLNLQEQAEETSEEEGYV